MDPPSSSKAPDLSPSICCSRRPATRTACPRRRAVAMQPKASVTAAWARKAEVRVNVHGKSMENRQKWMRKVQENRQKWMESPGKSTKMDGTWWSNMVSPWKTTWTSHDESPNMEQWSTLEMSFHEILGGKTPPLNPDHQPTGLFAPIALNSESRWYYNLSISII